MFMLSPCLQHNLHPDYTEPDLLLESTVVCQKPVLLSAGSCCLATPRSPVAEVMAHRAPYEFTDKAEVAVALYAWSNGLSILV